MICSLCTRDLNPDHFFIDNGRPRGRHRWCRECHSRQQKKLRINSPHRRYSELKGNAVRRNLAWNLSFEDFVLWLWGAPCFFCGEPANGGVDRMNNEQWYDAYNAIACCKTCNSMKGKQTFHDFLTRTQGISERLGMTANQAIACGGK